MTLTEKQRRYWRLNTLANLALLLPWFAATFGVAYFAPALALHEVFGMPAPFFVGAVGAPLLYVALVGLHTRWMRRVDQAWLEQD